MEATIFQGIPPIFEESDDIEIFSDKVNSESSFEPTKKATRKIMCTNKWTVEEN